MAVLGYAKALGKLPSGIYVLIAGDKSEPEVILASWVQQCSFSPPMLSIAVGKERQWLKSLALGQKFTLNQLAQGQMDLYRAVSKKAQNSVLQDVATHNTANGNLVLSQAMSYLECTVRLCCESPGDHVLLLAEVLDGQVCGDGEPWVHLRKSGLSY